MGETRRNRQYFPNETEEMEALIYNYSPKYTGAIGSSFMQQYLFDEKTIGDGKGDGAERASASLLLSLISVFVIYRFWLWFKRSAVDRGNANNTKKTC